MIVYYGVIIAVLVFGTLAQRYKLVIENPTVFAHRRCGWLQKSLRNILFSVICGFLFFYE